MKSLVAYFDKSGSGDVEYAEFVRRCVGRAGKNDTMGRVAEKVRRKIRQRVASSSVSSGRSLDVRAAFADIDSGRTGLISSQDLAAMSDRMGWDLTKEEMRWILKKFDDNGDGRWSYREFCDFLSLDSGGISSIETRLRNFLQRKNEEGVRFSEQFEWFDQRGTGSISQPDFKAAMSKLGFALSESDVRKLMRKFDVDFDGKINYVDFLQSFAFGPGDGAMVLSGRRKGREGAEDEDEDEEGDLPRPSARVCRRERLRTNHLDGAQACSTIGLTD